MSQDAKDAGETVVPNPAESGGWTGEVSGLEKLLKGVEEKGVAGKSGKGSTTKALLPMVVLKSVPVNKT